MANGRLLFFGEWPQASGKDNPVNNIDSTQARTIDRRRHASEWLAKRQRTASEGVP
jgi:hypothetical protein